MGKLDQKFTKTFQTYSKRIINSLKAGKTFVDDDCKRLRKKITSRLHNLLNAVSSTPQKLTDYLSQIFAGFFQRLKSTQDKLTQFFNSLTSKVRFLAIKNFLRRLGQNIVLFLVKTVKVAKNFISEIIYFLNNSVKEIKNKIPFFGSKQLSLFSKPKLKQRQKKLSKISQVLNKLGGIEYRRLYLSVAITGIIIGLASFTYNFIFKDLPSAVDLTKKRQIVTTRILDRNGRLLYRIYQDENRTIIPLEQIPQDLINATIAIEDKDFYHHHGFSFKGIFRALIHNLKEDNLQGGSTITQQLVKNRLLNNKRTIRRKLREILLAILVEGMYSKDEILQMYLNEVPYGGSTYGIEEAAWKYFDKPAKDLSLGQSSMLAGLPVAPSVYTPFGPNPELSKRRQEEVLRRMVEDNFITIEDAYHARNEQLSYSKNIIDIKAPHFVMYVKKLLAEKYGEKVLQQGGLEVRTTLDLSLQRQTQKLVSEEVEKLSNLNVHNGAALVTNPQTGEILAMVGSKDYFDFENDGQVNVTLRPRQPGSSIKPLTYSLAFEEGQTPWTKIKDSPVTYHIPGSKPYSPKNYDNKFHGTVSIRQALANSYNVPAVKTLAKLGVDNLVDHGEELGITTWDDRQRFGLSLTLGAGEVLMTDMAKVYGSFANGGYAVDLDPFLKIENYKGEVLYQNECFDDPGICQKNQSLKPLTAYRITSILADNQARIPAFGRYSVLNIPDQEVAVKTGTTNNLRDNWTLGYTSDRLVGVWVGNNDNQSMSQVASGVTGASPIWNNIMRLMLDQDNPHQFVWPDGYQEVKICLPTGTLPCKSCPQISQEVFKQGQIPQNNCNWRYFIESDQKQPEDRNREKIL